MAVTSYAALQTFVTAHLTLDSVEVAQLPNLIQMAEAELQRLLTMPDEETVATTSTVSGTQTLAMPSGLSQFLSISITGNIVLRSGTLNDLRRKYNGVTSSGKPADYAIAAGSIYLFPVPDAIYTLSLLYMKNFTALSDTNQTNWLLTNHPDVYLYATIYQVEAFRVNDERAAHAQSVMGGLINQINAAGNDLRYAGGMRMRSEVVV